MNHVELCTQEYLISSRKNAKKQISKKLNIKKMSVLTLVYKKTIIKIMIIKINYHNKQNVLDQEK